jgi:hypothetical protein
MYGVVDSVAAEADGSYRLERVTPGIANVKAFVTRHRGMSRTAIVEPGKTTIVDFGFPAARSTLEGRVTVEGEPVEGAILRLSVGTEPGAYETYATSTGSSGVYRFEGLPPGEASMAAQFGGRNGPARRKSVSFHITADNVTVQDVDITAGNCAVSGKIDVPRKDRNGAALILDGEVVLEEFTVAALESLDSLMVAHSREMSGTYRFDGLAPGVYTLLVVIYPDEVDSVSDSMGQALVASEVVHLEEGQEIAVDLWPSPMHGS